ncbi:MAG: hypothetical protein ACREMB_19770, partial [Candidatus Rokuibacteriota bacterium]
MNPFRLRGRRLALIPLLLLLAPVVCRETADAAQLQLTWADNSTNEDGFKVERKVGTAGTFAQIATLGPNVTAYTDPGVT